MGATSAFLLPLILLLLSTRAGAAAAAQLTSSFTSPGAASFRPSSASSCNSTVGECVGVSRGESGLLMESLSAGRLLLQNGMIKYPTIRAGNPSRQAFPKSPNRPYKSGCLAAYNCNQGKYM